MKLLWHVDSMTIYDELNYVNNQQIIKFIYINECQVSVGILNTNLIINLLVGENLVRFFFKSQV